MHSVDATTESMIRSVLAASETRLRLDPFPLDQGSRDPAELDAAMQGLLGPGPHNPDQVLGVYTSVVAPAVISADSPRFLGFIPAAPTKAALLFDMLVSCASIQGISWLEAAGAVHAEEQVLRLIAAGAPASSPAARPGPCPPWSWPGRWPSARPGPRLRPGGGGGWRSARTRIPRSPTRCGSARWTRSSCGPRTTGW